MSEDKQTQTETVSKAEYDKLKERSYKLEGELTDVKKTLDKFKDINVDEYHANKQAIKQLESEKAKTPEEIQILVAKAEEKGRKDAQKTLDELRDENKNLKSKNHELTVVDRVFSESAANINDDMHSIFKDLIRKSCALEEDGSITVKNDKGEVRHSASNPAQKMSHIEFIEELKTQYPSFVKSTMKSGAKGDGTKSSAGGTNGTVSFDSILAMGDQKGIELMSKMTPEQIKASFTGKH